MTEILNQHYLRGVGSAIKYYTIHHYAVSACSACHATAREMDEIGPEQCLARIDEFAQRLHENAQLKKWNQLLDFFAFRMYGLEKHKELIRTCTDLHLAEVAKKNA